MFRDEPTAIVIIPVPERGVRERLDPIRVGMLNGRPIRLGIRNT